MFGEWQVQELCVTAITEDSTGILTYGVTVDGCASAVVQPHIRAAATRMGMGIAGMRAGTASPFFTVVDRPSRASKAALMTFEKLLNEQVIRGPYCDEAGNDMIIRRGKLGRAVVVGQTAGQYKVDAIVTGATGLHVGLEGRIVEERRTGLAASSDRGSVHLTVTAADDIVLARRLRLFANLTGIRWDRRDEQTLRLVGEPLV